ncbi:MAG: hypothetical protein AB7N70_01135 [Dehalococcoidia bacterium]
MPRLARKVRQEDSVALGRSTVDQLLAAIDADRDEEARDLAQYTLAEVKPLHDLFCDWVWDLLTQVAHRFGECAMYDVLRASQETWMMKRTWKGFLGLTIPERVALIAEMMRAHQSGPRQDGSVEVVEAADRYVVRMDPCGSGGRMRRGDHRAGTASRLGGPYNFGSTEQEHEWSWGQSGVPYYCVHCAVNEQLSMEWGGHPLWVTEFDPDPAKPCAWTVYKRAEWIPVRFYERMGRSKPAPGEGRY